MFVKGDVKDYVYESEETGIQHVGEVVSFAETQDDTVRCGLIYFFIILSANGVDHPHHEMLQTRGYGTDTSSAPAAREAPKAFTNLTPPLVRVRCTKCGEEKDAWVTEDGNLEDPRDAWHYHEEGVEPTEPITDQ